MERWFWGLGCKGFIGFIGFMGFRCVGFQSDFIPLRKEDPIEKKTKNDMDTAAM